MAIYYVRSTDGNDGDSGATWALAKATIAGALTVAGPGDRIWVSQVHAETSITTITLTSPGTAAQPVEVFCGADSATPPTARTSGASVSTTAVGANVAFFGHAIFYGIAFNAGTGAGGSTSANIQATGTQFRLKFENCLLALRGTNAGARIAFGTNGSGFEMLWQLVNTDVLVSNSAQAIDAACMMEWHGGAVQLGVLPSALFKQTTAHTITAEVVGVDFTNITAGGALVGALGGKGAQITFRDCKVLTSTPVVTAGYSAGPGQVRILFDNCNPDVEIYRYLYEGEIFRENTIVKTGGASDGTAWSYKLTTSANTQIHTPLYSPDIFVWNATTGTAKNLAVDVLHDSATALTNGDAWVEVQYLPGAAADNKSGFASDRVADTVQTTAAQAVSTATWSAAGLTNPNKQKLDVSVTPGQVGWFRLRVALAKPAYTLFVDPKVTVT